MRWPLLLLFSVGCSQPCAWIATYDLTGSTFSIDALIDFEITVAEPYTDDDHMGPGTLTLRIEDESASEGFVQILEYHLTQNHVTGAAVATVTTDLQNDAEADDGCAVADGSSSGGTTSFSPAEIGDYCQVGTISCEGSLCGSSGSPPANDPEEVDRCGTLPLNAFVFSDDGASFTMEGVVVQSSDDSTSTLALVGTRTSLEKDEDCACP